MYISNNSRQLYLSQPYPPTLFKEVTRGRCASFTSAQNPKP